MVEALNAIGIVGGHSAAKMALEKSLQGMRRGGGGGRATGSVACWWQKSESDALADRDGKQAGSPRTWSGAKDRDPKYGRLRGGRVTPGRDRDPGVAATALLVLSHTPPPQSFNDYTHYCIPILDT